MIVKIKCNSCGTVKKIDLVIVDKLKDEIKRLKQENEKLKLIITVK